MEVFSLRSSCMAITPISPHTMTPPPDFLPKIIPHTETCMLPLRYSFAFAKISSDIEYEGWGFGAVKLNHDMGYLIPHIPWGPPTPILAAHIAISKCKVMFGKAKIKLNGEQAGWWFPGLAFFQVCANPMPIPIGIDFSAIWTTVKYSFSWGDWIAGLIRVGIDIVLSLLIRKVLGSSRIKGPLEALILRTADKLYPVLGPVLFKLVGYFNYKVIEEVLKRSPSEAIKKLVTKTPVGEPLEHLANWIDEQLGDAPTPTPAADPTTAPLLNAVPMAP